MLHPQPGDGSKSREGVKIFRNTLFRRKSGRLPKNYHYQTSVALYLQPSLAVTLQRKMKRDIEVAYIPKGKKHFQQLPIIMHNFIDVNRIHISYSFFTFSESTMEIWKSQIFLLFLY